MDPSRLRPQCFKWNYLHLGTQRFRWHTIKEIRRILFISNITITLNFFFNKFTFELKYLFTYTTPPVLLLFCDNMCKPLVELTLDAEWAIRKTMFSKGSVDSSIRSRPEIGIDKRAPARDVKIPKTEFWKNLKVGSAAKK